MKIQLLTGIPRSGTTLCCNLLNQAGSTVALHEPIDPQKLTALTPDDAVKQIRLQVTEIEQAVRTGTAFEHGDGKLQLDNPVGETVKGALREVSAKRGNITLSPQPDDTTLVIKQNALFTALLDALKPHYQITGIVRNPIPVLLSWQSVNLPVNKGHIPAGERYDAQLKRTLNNECVFTNQLRIYAWFCEKFIRNNINIVRYEDIIENNGMPLFSTLRINNDAIGNLTSRIRPYSTSKLQFLKDNIEAIYNHAHTLYSREQIEDALAQHQHASQDG